MSKTTIPNYRVSIGFAALSDGALDEFTTNIITCMTGNTAFPNPPMPLTGEVSDNLTKLQTAFRDAMAVAAQGGKQATAAKSEAREALLNGLRMDAAYVQSIANHDLSLLLTSGYAVASKNRAQSPLDTPVIVGITNGTSGQLTLQVQPVLNARAYEAQMSTTTGTWQHVDTFPSVRGMVLQNLTPGTTYSARVRAVGGSTGHSDWSNPVSHMAT